VGRVSGVCGLLRLVPTAISIGSTDAVAQTPVAWLIGQWSPRLPRKEDASFSPGALQITLEGEILQIVESGASVADLRCRTDGTEFRFRQVKAPATIDYALKCTFGKASLKIRGRSLASGMQGIPP
jgi:hypothetical protein